MLGMDGNRKHQFLIDGMVKALPFLTGFIQLPFGPQPSEKTRGGEVTG